MIFCVVLLERITSKVIFEIAPNKVCMIGIILSVRVFNNKINPLNPEVMGAISFQGTTPSKM